jgi:2-oxoglutarate ferredoxin oxidoreductase subunit delta
MVGRSVRTHRSGTGVIRHSKAVPADYQLDARLAPERKPVIVIDERYCKGCGICVRFCPKQVLEISKEVNSRGYYTPYVVDPDKCSNCHQCTLFCPDFAIFIVEEAEVGER